MLAGQLGQDHRAQRHAENAEWKLDQPVGVIQPTDAAGDQKRGDQGIDQQIDLRHRGAEQGRQHQLQHLLHALGGPTPARSRQQFQPQQERHLKSQLHDAGDEYAPGQPHHRLRHAGSQPQRGGDHGQVEQHRRDRRNGELAATVQHPAGQGGQRDEQQIGKGDAQHLHRQLVFVGIDGEARRKQQDQQWRGQHADGGDGEQDRAQGAGHLIHQFLHFRWGALGLVFREHRHEGLRERPFGEQPAQEVGDAKRHEEGVGTGSGAEQLGVDHVADEAGDAGQRGHGADHAGRFEKGLAHGRWGPALDGSEGADDSGIASACQRCATLGD